ncbi:trypsin-like peptidase domain-containing protein [Streptomyces sp. ISL-98]|uniref:nSTAND1 domain-containing NTPase n=1 Tax=Streptomyces sp. ISL-98 TaxID=2819192 RepID=UPI001BEA07D8|nr:trypsin-like peptidase domain-containing protein [Streptomyces sp. ISL-98]MBT2508598.1 trypsin-like peptidase domain-containing protein [Streptomyces sp. ISL-98]
MVTEVGAAGSRNADEALASAVARITGQDGTPVGAGLLVTRDLVLTCAHVVSDALGRPRDEPVATGTAVTVGFPLVRPVGDAADSPAALVEHWIPTRPDRTGDLAVLRLKDGKASDGARPLPMVSPRGTWDHGARAVGFTGGEPGEIWFRGRLTGATSEGWLQLSRADGQAVHVREGFSGGPVWDNELGAVVGLVVAAQREQDAQQSFVLHTDTVLRELPDLAPVLRPPSPFRGLVPFEEGDEDVFFGRDADIEEVITALRGDDPTVTLYGPSGCGKSSLARAGVAPRMRRAGYDVLVVDAGKISSPRSALATELYESARAAEAGQDGPPRVESADQVEAWLAKGLADTLHRVRGTTRGGLVVVLDQAEALLDRSEAEVEEAVDLLFPKHRPAAGLRVLVTLRADFMDAMLKHPRLGPALRGGRTLPLTPMTRDQLRDVITKPVESVLAMAYEAGLDRRILDDAGGEPGILPLLGFVLEKLWERQAGGRLLTTAYEAMGGVSGALEQHAERAWQECVGGQEERQAEARRLLTGLVRVLPGSETPLRRRLTREEAGPDRWRLAEAFARRRLLVLRGDEGEPETAELAHEALTTAWAQLRHRVRADGEFLAGRAELGHDLDRWRRGSRSADLLPGFLHLAAIERRLAGRERELTEEERDFLALARQRHRKRRARVRAAWTTMAVVFALIVGLGTFLVYQAQVSAQRDAEARSRALASLSNDLAPQDPGLGALAAIAAYDVAPTNEARGALMRRYELSKETAWLLSGAEGMIRAVATSNDGAVTLVTTDTGGRATLFVRRADGTVLREQLRLPVSAVSPMVSRDGRRIAYLASESESNDLYWHDVDSTAEDVLGPAHSIPAGAFIHSTQVSDITRPRVSTAAFSPDAKRVVSVSQDGRLWLWDLQTEENRRLTRPRDIEGVWFGPDEESLVVHRRNEETFGLSVTALDLRTERERPLADDVEGSLDVAYVGLSGDGGVLAACSDAPREDPVYRAVRVSDGRELARWDSHPIVACDEIAVDRTGTRFVSKGTTGEWTIFDMRRGKAARTLGSTSGSVSGMPLLHEGSDPVVLAWDKSWVAARPMSTGTVLIGREPVLLGDGRTMVAYYGRGRGLAVIDHSESVTDWNGEWKIPARADRDAEVGLRENPEPLQVNPAETLVADLIAPDRIAVRALPSLRQVTEITTARPPTAADGKPVALELQFLDDDELLTVSGSVIEQWNVRDGRRLTKPIDARDLGLTRQKAPQFAVRSHFKPGLLQITVFGEQTVHAIDRRTGKERKDLGVTFNDDFVVAAFTSDGRYALVLTTGNLLEGWSVRTGERPTRVFGPLGPPMTDYTELRSVGNSGFFIANGNYARYLWFSDLDRVDSYDFTEDQNFYAASRDGKTLLRSPTDRSGMDVFRLDPELWKRHLCEVLGRDLTADERRTLPSGIPDRICPT